MFRSQAPSGRGRTLLFAGLLFTVLVSMAVAAGGRFASDGRASERDDGNAIELAQLKLSQDLAQAPALYGRAANKAPELTDTEGPEREYARDTVESAARAISVGVPFPPGLNSTSTLNWARTIDRGVGYEAISDRDLQRVVQANAMRDWLWFAANKGLTPTQRGVVENIPNWSAFRGDGDGVAKMVNEVLKLGTTEAARAFTATFYGQAEGEAPPRPRW